MKKSATKKGSAKKAAAAPGRPEKRSAKKPATKKTAAKPVAAKPAKKYQQRADLGADIEPFFAKQPPALRAILDALRALVEQAAPDARAAIKWGMPFYERAGGMMCALGAHRAHVNLILPGPPGTYADPNGLLEGEAKTGRHLKLTALSQLQPAEVRRWLKVAAARVAG